MATTNHVIVANFPTLSGTNSWNVMWKFTRAAIKGGYKHTGSSDGTTLALTTNPLTDRFNATPGTQSTFGSLTTSGTTNATIVLGSRGRATVTLLSGSTSSLWKGQFFCVTSGTNSGKCYQIESILSSSQFEIDSRQATGLSADTSVSWQVRDVLGDAYPAALSGANAVWWSGIGPSTVRVPITVAPTGTFIRGENVVQSTTGAEGELIGYVFDSTSASGWMTIAPRIRGNTAPTVAWGWTTGNTITGQLSGATASQNGTANEFRHEIVVWRNGASSLTAGSIFHGVFDPVVDDAAAETAWSFAKKITTATGVTATVAPGGGGTNNSFPAHAWVAWGTNTTGTGSTWFNGTLAKAQIAVADCIPESNYSADGSFNVMVSNTAVSGGFTGHGLMRLDNTEEGDCDPYVSYSPGVTESLTTNARAASLGANTSIADIYNTSGLLLGATTSVFFKGWRFRSGESATTSASFLNYETSVLQARQSGPTTFQAAQNTGTPLRTANDALNPGRKVREPIWMISTQAATRHLKGSLRWMFLVIGGSGADQYDSMFVQASSSNPAIIVGPFNGTSVQLT